jgi:hypothetical protein
MSRSTSPPIIDEARAVAIGGGPSLELDLPGLCVKKDTTFEWGRRSGFFIHTKKQKKSMFSYLKVASSM